MLKTLSVLFALLAIGLGVGIAPAAAQGRPDCAAVLRALHKVKGHGTHRPDSSDVASQLGTDSDWVETCATSYGRHLRPAPLKHGEGDSELTPDREEKEYEEVAREEADQEANRVQGDLRNGVYATKDRGIDPDSSAEWEPFLTHEWQPYITHEWAPFIHDDDDPGME
ncbi:MAG: hypothetical protein ABI629_12265 [bacterium]